MRIAITGALAALLLSVAAAGPAVAQTSGAARPAVRAAKPARLFISVSAGIQSAPDSFDDAFDLTLYTEPERITVDYPSEIGGLVGASVSYRLWRQFVAGFGATYSSSSGDAEVTAQLPHPFFDNTFRSIEGTANTSRTETGAHLMLGLIWPVSNRIRVLVSGGPSWLSVEQTIVTDVSFSETYPYDTAEFTGVKTSSGTRSAAGFNAGADVSWMFSRNIGIGGMVQYTHARIKANAGADRTVSFDAGGAQVGAGVRFAF